MRNSIRRHTWSVTFTESGDSATSPFDFIALCFWRSLASLSCLVLILIGTAVVGATPPCAPLPMGAVGWWPLNEQNGATSISEVVGGHTGVPVSGPVGPLGSNSPAPVTGMVGGALHFYQANTYVRVPNHPALNFGAGSFTIDAWINPVQVNAQLYQPIVEKAQALNTSGTSVAGYKLFVKNAKVHFAISDGTSVAVVSANIAYGTWQFVVAERAGNTLHLFINGTLAATATLSPGFGSTSNGADLLIGGITPLGLPTVPAIGEIDLDEVELFNRALMPAEIQAIYNAGSTGKCTAASGQPDPAVNKVMINPSTGPVFPGQQISYQITVSNLGSAAFTASFVGVSDPIPASLTGVTFAAPPPWNCSLSGNALMCQYPGPVTLNPGQQLPPITVTATVGAGVAGIKNCARIFFPGGVVDANPNNNLACDAQQIASCVAPPPGMVAWYWMDGSAIDTTILGGFNNPSATNAISFTAGRVGQGVTFGTGGYIDIPHSPALANQQFTVDAWVEPQGAGPNNDFWGSVVVQKGLSPSMGGNLNVSLSVWWGAQQQRFVFGFGNINTERIVSSSTSLPGQWHHVAATYDGNTFKLYVNGALAAQQALVKTITYDPATPWTIGSTSAPFRSAGFPRTFNGIIDEVEIFNRALTQAEIQAIYNAGAAGKCKATLANPNSPSSTSRRAQRRRNLILGVAGTALGAVQIFQRRRSQSAPQPTDKVGTPTKTQQQRRP